MTFLTRNNNQYNRLIIEDDTDEEEVIFIHSSKINKNKSSKVIQTCIVDNCKNKTTNYHNLCKKHCGKKKYDKEDCAICIENCPVNPISCGHWIHFDCIVKSEKKECPICKESLTFTKEQCKIFNQYRREQTLKRQHERIQQQERHFVNQRVGQTSRSVSSDTLIEFIQQLSIHDSRIDIEEFINYLLFY